MGSNKLDVITLASTGNAADFGGAVMTAASASGVGGASNAHGGIA